jgi:hypothetical protein
MCRIDGSRHPVTIAKLVSEDLSRTLSAEQVRHLVRTKLLPLGVVADEAAPPTPPTANPLLALRARARSCPSARRTPPEHCCGRFSTDPLSWLSSAASWPWTTG